jgi:hypothetical protein
MLVVFDPGKLFSNVPLCEGTDPELNLRAEQAKPLRG